MLKLLLLTLMILSCQKNPETLPQKQSETKEVILPEVLLVKDKEGQPSLEPFIHKAMLLCNSKSSEVRQKVLARTIATVVPSFIGSREGQEMFVILLCIESGLNPSIRKSTVGATGIAQIMPKYAQNFADLCELGKLGQDDIEDLTINLSLGACFYNYLLTKVESVTLASAAYNAGPNSETVRKLIGLSSINSETANYVAKAAYIKEKLNREPTSDNPKAVPDGKGREGTDNGVPSQERSSAPL